MLPLHSPLIAKLEVRVRGRVRRSRLFYLRDRTGVARTFDPQILVFNVVHNDFLQSLRDAHPLPLFLQLTRRDGKFVEAPPSNTLGEGLPSCESGTLSSSSPSSQTASVALTTALCRPEQLREAAAAPHAWKSPRRANVAARCGPF